MTLALLSVVVLFWTLQYRGDFDGLAFWAEDKEITTAYGIGLDAGRGISITPTAHGSRVDYDIASTISISAGDGITITPNGDDFEVSAIHSQPETIEVYRTGEVVQPEPGSTISLEAGTNIDLDLISDGNGGARITISSTASSAAPVATPEPITSYGAIAPASVTTVTEAREHFTAAHFTAGATGDERITMPTAPGGIAAPAIYYAIWSSVELRSINRLKASGLIDSSADSYERIDNTRVGNEDGYTYIVATRKRGVGDQAFYLSRGPDVDLVSYGAIAPPAVTDIAQARAHFTSSMLQAGTMGDEIITLPTEVVTFSSGSRFYAIWSSKELVGIDRLSDARLVEDRPASYTRDTAMVGIDPGFRYILSGPPLPLNTLSGQAYLLTAAD